MTIVKFLLDKDGGVFAYFPQLNYNVHLYNQSRKLCYAHLDQHSACDVAYAESCDVASPDQYTDLYNELLQVGYKLRVIKDKVRKPRKNKSTYIDGMDRVWSIKKESLPKKRGEYTYFIADTLDGKFTVKGETKKELLGNIDLITGIK